ncbi:hypothetical protein MRB53_038774 [Persea americana]|nr:hypothetical protein MRB53_038774 [Persea americana]
MIMQRNELACYVRERLSLPPMIRNTHTCSKCYAKTSCFTYHKLSEDGDGETSGLRDKFDTSARRSEGAFANVVLIPGSEKKEEGGSRINRYRYAFRKNEKATGFSFTESQITTGEPIVVSDEHGHYGLALGYVTGVFKNHILVAVDRRLHNARIRRYCFDEEKNQVFAGIMSVAGAEDAPSPLREQDLLRQCYSASTKTSLARDGHSAE